MYGYIQSHGTQHALFWLLQPWQKEPDESSYIGTVLMDLSKANTMIDLFQNFEACSFALTFKALASNSSIVIFRIKSNELKFHSWSSQVQYF